MSLRGDPPYFVSVQAGAWRSEGPAGTAAVETFAPDIEHRDPHARRRAFPRSPRAVDLSTAELIVAVGRGIKDKDNIPLVEDLARRAGRRIGRFPPDLRQRLAARWSGKSAVRARRCHRKLYVAVGISGAIQHLVGMKGSRTVVAINKDAEAPIFDIADYGIVGDLFEIVPALVTEIRKLKP